MTQRVWDSVCLASVMLCVHETGEDYGEVMKKEDAFWNDNSVPPPDRVFDAILSKTRSYTHIASASSLSPPAHLLYQMSAVSA